MKVELTFNNSLISITTEHSASSYNQPVVLLDGELTDIAVDIELDELDEPQIPTALEQLYGLRNIPGRMTRRALMDLADEMFPLGIKMGADCDRVVAEFKRRGKEMRDAELRGEE